MKRLIYFILLSFIGLSSYAATQVSLLTAGPTDEYVFFLYGHTAIRVKTDSEDVVYNYGYFSMQQDNFILNFMLGKPMYSLGVTTFQEFLDDYGSQGRSVTEQVLNLSEDEATALKNKLDWNALPEHRDYTYNFYFDNCATRPRDLIEEAVNGLVYEIDSKKMPTFRQAIRNKSYSAQWYTVGADLCLGWMSDEPMTVKDAAFLPDLLLQEFDHARRIDNGNPIVQSKVYHLPQTHIIHEGMPKVHWPMITFILVSIVYCLLYFFEKGKRIGITSLRSLIYFILGTGGVVIWFLALISAHPHTFPNANMFLFHPLWYVLAVTVWKRSSKVWKMNYWLYLINFVAVVIYLMLGYKQVLPQGVSVLALLVGVDALLQTLAYRGKARL